MNARRDRETERELRFHVEEHAARLMAQGVPAEEARRRATLAMGGVPQVQEECRDVRPWRWLEQLGANLRYALRGMRKSPALTLTVVLTIGVCVAVNTAIFTLVDSVLLRPLPFPDAHRIVTVMNEYPKASIIDNGNSATGDYFDRKSIAAFAEQALIQRRSVPVERGQTPVQLRGLSVTPSFFPLLRAQAAEGRLFTESDGQEGGQFVVVLSQELRREFFGEGRAIGESIRLNGQTYRVVGVLPPGFRYESPEYRFFQPMALGADARASHHNNCCQYIARLRDGATVAQAQQQLNALNANITNSLPELKDLLINAGFYGRIVELQPWLVRKAKPSLQLLWMAALLVLVVGAVNLAGLALARATGRGRETATRLALGAGRGTLALQYIAESALPGLLGGALGLAGGWLALRYGRFDLLPQALEIGLTPRVALYALAAVALVSLLTGTMPLLTLGRINVARGVADGGRSGSARYNTALRRGLVAAQVALAFVLCAGAGVLTASLRELLRVNPGFQVEGLWTASTYLPQSSFPDGKSLLAAGAQMTEVLRALPAVESVGAASQLPFRDRLGDSVILPEGYVSRPGESAVSPGRLVVTRGFLETLGVRPLEGRLLEDRDTDAVLVDEKVARRFWPGQSAVGRRLAYANSKQLFTVVGVLPSLRFTDLTGAANPNGFYCRPWGQEGFRVMSLAWRPKPGAEAEALTAVRREFPSLVPGGALFEAESLASRRDESLLPRRVALSLALVFAGVALLLAAIGIYGLFAFLLAQRRREIGIRMAMGCRPAGAIEMFVRDGLALGAAGLAVGLLGVAGVRRWIEAELYGVGALDPLVLAATAGLLLAVVTFAVALPAWRAAQVDPARVLRDA